MKIKNDIDLDIAIARHAYSIRWKNISITWTTLLQKLSHTTRTRETIADYLALGKEGKGTDGKTGRDRQSDIKDVGGFVGGILNGGYRSKSSVMCRTVICLDIDHGTSTTGVWDTYKTLYCEAACLYSTHKHTPDEPRLRLVIPLDRAVGTDEYEAIARKIAGNMGIEIFDITTYQFERLMFWPSTAKDGEFIFKVQDGPMLSADDILSTYIDWQDSSQWPVAEGEILRVQNEARKQEDPETKRGIVGTFCRVYSIPDVIATFLADAYLPSENPERYTYVHGTTSKGLVIYEDKFAYSNHSTDPSSGILCNSFDLVRLHKFAAKDLDTNEGTKMTSLPSYKAMIELATRDKAVRKLIGRERLENAAADFGLNAAGATVKDAEGYESEKMQEKGNRKTLEALLDFAKELPDSVQSSSNTKEKTTTESTKAKSKSKNSELPITDVEVLGNDDWLGDMDVDARGTPLTTIDNVVKIIANDRVFKGKIGLDLFSHREAALGQLFWRTRNSNIKVAKTGGLSPMQLLNYAPDLNGYLRDSDDAAIRWYMEKTYNIVGKDKIRDGFSIALEKCSYHPIKDYLDKIVWDGETRLDKMLIDFHGADDNEYVRTVTRKTFVAAVARVYEPGCKFDYMLTLIGPQGCRKSSFIKMMAGAWFSDSITTMTGKESYEQLQGSWIVEIAELSAMKSSDTEQIKQYISKQVDRFRVAFGRRVEDFPRQCIPIATTNKLRFLKDWSGNRRFWPVVLRVHKPKYDVMNYLDGDMRDQLWAEAKHLYDKGEALCLSDELEAVAARVQEGHMEIDERQGMVDEFCNMLLPKSWYEMLPHERKQWMTENNDPTNAGVHEKGTQRRKAVCAAEVCIELFDMKAGALNTQNTKEIHEMLKKVTGWKIHTGKTYFGIYGKQVCYIREKQLIL